MARSTLLVLAALGTMITSIFLGGLAVSADTSTPEEEIRWSVEPATDAGPDGRRSVNNEMEPGQTVEEFLSVRNVSSTPIVFRLTAADGFFTRAGRFDILTSDQDSVALGSWIRMQDEIAVPADSTVVVPFSIQAPDTAEPGDYSAGITASVVSVQSAEDGTSVGVESRVGFRVNTHITGDAAPSVALDNSSGSYDLSWNPFKPGEASVTFDVTNTGNMRVSIEGTVKVGDRSMAFPAKGEPLQELLPGDTRLITVVVPGVWPLLAVPAHIDLTPEVLSLDTASIGVETKTENLTIFAPPLPQLSAALGGLLLLYALARERGRRRRRLLRLLDDARQEGRRSASDAATSVVIDEVDAHGAGARNEGGT